MLVPDEHTYHHCGLKSSVIQKRFQSKVSATSIEVYVTKEGTCDHGLLIGLVGVKPRTD